MTADNRDAQGVWLDAEHVAVIRESLIGKRNFLQDLFIKVEPVATASEIKWAIDEWKDEIARIDAALAALDAAATPQPMPDWSQAPEWAMWHTIDCNGTGYWHENTPSRGVIGWGSSGSPGNRWHSDKGYDLPLGVDWRQTLQQRPPAAQDG